MLTTKVDIFEAKKPKRCYFILRRCVLFIYMYNVYIHCMYILYYYIVRHQNK